MSKGTKIEMLKWTHPEWSQWLITDVNNSHKNVANNHLNGHPDPYGEVGLAGLKVEVVHMTKEEIDALPEFDG